MSDTAANPPPFFYEKRCDVSSGSPLIAVLFTLSAPSPWRGSIGAQTSAADMPVLLDDYRASIKGEQLEDFTARTERGRKLWALRQKYIAEGGKLYSTEEIQRDLAKQRDEND